MSLEPALVTSAILEAAQHAGLGVFVSTLDGDRPITVFHNAAAVAIAGWSSEEMIGRDLVDLIVTPEDRPEIMKLVRGDASLHHFETTLVHKDGKRVPIWCAAVRVVVEGRPIGVGFVVDITRQRESEARFEQLAAGAPDAIVISRDGRVLYANHAAARLLAYPDSQSMVGVMMSDFLSPSELATMRERIREVHATGKPLAAREYPAKRKDGTPIIAEITSLPIAYEGGPAVIAIARDVTDRARMQARLAHADRLAALGTLAAGVAHEVNNPLAYVMLGLEALQRQIEQAIPDDKSRASALRLLADITDGTQRVARIARELKSFARPDDGEIGPIEIAPILRSAERMLAREISASAVLELDLARAPIVRANGPRLHQVFVNLLLNAVQAAHPNRVVHIVVSAGTKGEQGFIEVRDDGRGIESANLPKIFDPFFTTKQPGVGTGLGLFVCLGIVRQLGGDIAVESEEGRGATFRVLLPLGGAPRPIATPEPEPARRRANILIVDDEPHVGAMLGQLLSSNHEVVVVRNGEAALAALLGDHRFDVVFCDLVMPGMSGIDLYERIAIERPGLERRFVLMTGGAFTPRAQKFLEAIPNACIDKPFRFQALEELLAEHLDGQSQA